MRLYPLWPNPQLEYGLATLDRTLDTIVGICCKDDEQGRRRLAVALDLYWRQQWRGNDRLTRMARAPMMLFEIRPDWLYSRIGSAAWGNFPGNLPPYYQVGSRWRLFARAGPFGLEYPLDLVARVVASDPVATAPPRTVSTVKAFRFRGYMGSGLDPNLACLGHSFLRHGILLWESGVSYFVPLDDAQDASAWRWDTLAMPAWRPWPRNAN